jgi:hypothetical protein
MTVRDLEPVGKEILFHSNEVISQVFVPRIVIGDPKRLKTNVTKVKQLIDRVI